MRKVLEFHVTLNKVSIITYFVIRVKSSFGLLENIKFNIAHVPLCHTIRNTFLLFFAFSKGGPTTLQNSEPERQHAKVKLAEQLRIRKRTLTGCAERSK